MPLLVWTSIIDQNVTDALAGMKADVSTVGSSILGVILIIAAIGFIVATIARR
jgi:hypothetical protein